MVETKFREEIPVWRRRESCKISSSTQNKCSRCFKELSWRPPSFRYYLASIFIVFSYLLRGVAIFLLMGMWRDYGWDSRLYEWFSLMSNGN